MFFGKLTPKEIRERDARAEAEAAPVRARHQRLLDAASGNPVALAVAELHQPVIDVFSHTCDGCDFDGFGGEPPTYPCQTTELLEEHFGLRGQTVIGQVVSTRNSTGPHLHFENGGIDA